MIHEIVLNGYTAHNSNSRCLHFGTAESYGIEQIHITPGADWENLLIKATFHPPSGDSVVVLLGEDGVIDVPPEATAVAAGEYNPGLIVFSGAEDGVQRISADIAYTVLGHAPVDGKDPEPTPSQWEQLAVQYQSKVDKQQGAENAGKVLGIGEDGLVMPVEQTGGGGVGNNGATFIPSVSEDGVISWTNDGDLPNPEPVNIKGAPGKPGDNYVLTEADKQEIAQEAADLVDVPDKLPNPNALTFTGAATGTYDGSAPLTVEIPQGGSGGGSSEWKLIGEATSDGTGDTVGIYVPIEMEQYSELYIYGNHLKGGTHTGISGGSKLVWYEGYNWATTNSADILTSLYSADYSMTAHIINAGGLIMSWFSLSTGYCSQVLPVRPSHSVREDRVASSVKYIRLHTVNNGAVPAGSTLQVWGRKV